MKHHFSGSKENQVSLANVITKNLENHLLREKEINDLEEEVKEKENLQSHAMSGYDLDQSLMDEEKVKELVLITKREKSDDLKRKLYFFTFVFILFMV